MGVKERKGTGKTMLSPGVAWKCQAWEKWLFQLGVYSTRWEVSQPRLLSTGVSKNCGGATRSRVLEGLAPLAPRRIPPVASQGDPGICCCCWCAMQQAHTPSTVIDPWLLHWTCLSHYLIQQNIKFYTINGLHLITWFAKLKQRTRCF